MKKILTIICCIMMFSFTFALTGCVKEEEPKVFTINFIVEGEVWKTLTSDKIDELGTPTKQYCDFAGWEFDTETVENNSCNVYAKFTLNSRYMCLQVMSAAMSPALNMGDYIIIDTEVTEFEVNDIIVYQLTDSLPYMAHRIIEINDGEYTIKGDANSNNSGTISIEQIVGLVCENIGSTLPDDVIR
jgi:hypothetical protein